MDGTGVREQSSLVVLGVSHGLFASLQGFGVLVLQRLEVRHGLHALELQALVVVTRLHARPADTQTDVNVPCGRIINQYLSNGSDRDVSLGSHTGNLFSTSISAQVK